MLRQLDVKIGAHPPNGAEDDDESDNDQDIDANGPIFSDRRLDICLHMLFVVAAGPSLEEKFIKNMYCRRTGEWG